MGLQVVFLVLVPIPTDFLEIVSLPQCYKYGDAIVTVMAMSMMAIVMVMVTVMVMVLA